MSATSRCQSSTKLNSAKSDADASAIRQRENVGNRTRLQGSNVEAFATDQRDVIAYGPVHTDADRRRRVGVRHFRADERRTGSYFGVCRQRFHPDEFLVLWTTGLDPLRVNSLSFHGTTCQNYFISVWLSVSNFRVTIIICQQPFTPCE